jgi:hypothetical protein
MRKWKWVFVNGYERKSLCSTEVEFLSLCKGGKNGPTFLGVMLKYNDISL